MDRASPWMRAERDLTLIFSRVGCCSGWTSFIEEDLIASSFFCLLARSLSLLAAILDFQNACSLRCFISPMRFIAFIVVLTSSRSYLTGTLRRFSKSMVESCGRV